MLVCPFMKHNTAFLVVLLLFTISLDTFWQLLTKRAKKPSTGTLSQNSPKKMWFGVASYGLKFDQKSIQDYCKCLPLFSDYAQKFWSRSLQETPETVWIHRLRIMPPRILSNLGYTLQLNDLLRSFLQSNALELTMNNIWYKQQSLLKGQTLFYLFMVKLLSTSPEGFWRLGLQGN